METLCSPPKEGEPKRAMRPWASNVSSSRRRALLERGDGHQTARQFGCVLAGRFLGEKGKDFIQLQGMDVSLHDIRHLFILLKKRPPSARRKPVKKSQRLEPASSVQSTYRSLAAARACSPASGSVNEKKLFKIGIHGVAQRREHTGRQGHRRAAQAGGAVRAGQFAARRIKIHGSAR